MRSRIALRATAVAALLVVAGCATTSATFRSGVGDRQLEHPPYAAGRVLPADARIGHLPVAFQRDAAQHAMFDPRAEADAPAAAFARELTAYLDSLGVSVRLVDGGRVSAVAHRATRVPPDVQFGCAARGLLPGEECEARGDSALGRGPQAMRLAVGRPDAAWSQWAGEIARDAGVGHVLVVTLEVGQYLPRQAGWRGDKLVALGTGNTAKLPWLTSLETPVLVLQLTGALVTPDGQAVRIGAEGFHARRTRLAVSAAGAQELLTDDDVREARALRRDDLQGRPLAWQVAMRQLVAQLTGKGELVAGR